MINKTKETISNFFRLLKFKNIIEYTMILVFFLFEVQLDMFAKYMNYRQGNIYKMYFPMLVEATELNTFWQAVSRNIINNII